MKCKLLITLFSLVSYLPAQTYMESYNNNNQDYRTPNSDKTQRQGTAAAHSSISAAGISMLIWGLGLGTGIAVLAGLIPNSKGDGGGSNGHT